MRNNPVEYIDPTGEELQLIRVKDKNGNVVENISGDDRNALIIDFKDFRGLSGDKSAVASFTNYAFVHEVLHLFPSLLKDTLSDKDVTGPVENKVNEIRQVRGDLLRASYRYSQDNEYFGTMWFGTAKVNGARQIQRNPNGGIIVEATKLVTWNLRLAGK